MIYELSFEGHTLGYFPSEAVFGPFPDRISAFGQEPGPADRFGLAGEISQRMPFKG